MKKRLGVSILVLLTLGLSLFFIAQRFYITAEIARKIPRIFVREWYYKYIKKECSHLDKMPYSIKGELVTLRQLEFQDFKFYQPIIGNPYCSDSFFGSAEYLVPKVDPNFYLYMQLVNQFFGKRIMYSAIDNATNMIGGMVEMLYIKDTDSPATYHYEICGFARPREWGNGKALEAAALAVESFFKTTNEQELCAYTAPYNNRCHSFLHKCGFVFSHICQEEHSKNELIFKLNRTGGSAIRQTVHELLSRLQAKKNCSELPSTTNHQE